MTFSQSREDFVQNVAIITEKTLDYPENWGVKQKEIKTKRTEQR